MPLRSSRCGLRVRSGSIREGLAPLAERERGAGGLVGRDANSVGSLAVLPVEEERGVAVCRGLQDGCEGVRGSSVALADLDDRGQECVYGLIGAFELRVAALIDPRAEQRLEHRALLSCETDVGASHCGQPLLRAKRCPLGRSRARTAGTPQTESVALAPPHDDQLVDTGLGAPELVRPPKELTHIAGELGSLIVVNPWVRGSNRTMAFAPKSLTQTMSRLSTKTAYGGGWSPAPPPPSP